MTSVWTHTLIILSSACAGASLPYQPYADGWGKGRAETAYEYCTRVSINADTRAQRYLVAGIFGAIATAALTVTGAALGPAPNPENWAEKNRNTLVISSGSILAIPTTVLLIHSRNSSTASANAGSAMTLAPEDAMAKCIQARADLVNARGAIASDVSKDVTDRVKALQEVKDAAEEDAKEAKAAADAAPAGSPEKEHKEEEALEAEERARAAGEQISAELRKDDSSK